ncbi:MAG: lysylphosphatidylglycerol synthase transmembrane domain-containing protein [Pseudomonadota bacterium]
MAEQPGFGEGAAVRMRLLRLTASIAVLAVLFALMDTGAIFARLRGADLGWLGMALGGLTVLTFLMAWRWQMTANALDIELRYPRAVREYYIAQLLNLVLPGGLVGDAARAARLKAPRGLRQAAQSVIIERFIGQTTLFVLMFFGFLIAMFLPGGPDWPLWTWWFLAVGMVVAVLGWLYARQKGVIARFLATALDLMARPRQVVLSLTIALLIIFNFYACARATGTVLPANTLFTLIPLILTAMLVPLSVGGWGWREGAAAALFPLAGEFPSAGVAASIAYGAMMLLAASPAAFLMMLHPGQTPGGKDGSASMM